MPRAKTYRGRLVRNKRYHNKKMHWVTSYVRYGLELGVYSDAFDIFIRTLVRRIKKNLQNVIIVTGDTGSGKSTICIEIAMELAKALNTTFDLDVDYVYGAEDLWNKLNQPGASPISLFDEGSVSLNSMNSRKTGDRDIVVILDTMRSRGLTTIIALPDIRQCNPSIRRIHANYVIECSSVEHPFVKGYDRGFFEVKDKRFSKKKRYDPDPWWNVLYTGIFGPLPPKIDEQYQKIKRARQDGLLIDIRNRNFVERTEKRENYDKTE